MFQFFSAIFDVFNVLDCSTGNPIIPIIFVFQMSTIEPGLKGAHETDGVSAMVENQDLDSMATNPASYCLVKLPLHCPFLVLLETGLLFLHSLLHFLQLICSLLCYCLSLLFSLCGNGISFRWSFFGRCTVFIDVFSGFCQFCHFFSASFFAGSKNVHSTPSPSSGGNEYIFLTKSFCVHWPHGAN